VRLYLGILCGQDGTPSGPEGLIVCPSNADIMPAIAPATIAELARRSGVDVASIRLYEKIGLLPRPRRRRSRTGDPAYHQEHFDRLIFIERALALGFSFEAIADLAGVKGGLRTCDDVYRIAERRLAEVRRTIAELTRVEARLETLAGGCLRKGSRSDCTLLAELSRTAEC
jgi:DNA-binding transcriptional MerR regulator